MGARSEPLISSFAAGGTRRRDWLRAATPSLADVFLFALIGWLFLSGPYGWTVLLGDGDAGWHLRVGDYVLDTGRVPDRDLFSFSKPGEPWYAWEWLSETLFALAHRAAGLKGVVLLTGMAIAATALLLLRSALSTGANLLVALPLCLLAVGASDIHFLARPHVFTMLLLAASLWLLDSDRRRRTAWVWALIPLTAVWANLHGGFPALLAMLVLLCVGTAAEWAAGAREKREAVEGLRRYGLLAGGCALATVANPFGLELHRHILVYLNSDWIRRVVDEFQSPKFRDERMFQYEILLLSGLLAAGVLLSRKRVTEGLWILLWAHASLTSVRHVPLFAITVVPLLAAELSRWLAAAAEGRPRSSLAVILRSFGEDFGPAFRRNSVWIAAPWLALALLELPLAWPRDFPGAVFPTSIVARHGESLAAGRVFTTDRWAGYLIYRNYPRQRVFVDGRSDFYGPGLGGEYLKILNGRPEWERLMDRYGFDYALVEASSPIGGLLGRDPRWQEIDKDGRAVLFTRKTAGRAEVGEGGH